MQVQAKLGRFSKLIKATTGVADKVRNEIMIMINNGVLTQKSKRLSAQSESLGIAKD